MTSCVTLPMAQLLPINYYVTADDLDTTNELLFVIGTTP